MTWIRADLRIVLVRAARSPHLVCALLSVSGDEQATRQTFTELTSRTLSGTSCQRGSPGRGPNERHCVAATNDASFNIWSLRWKHDIRAKWSHPRRPYIPATKIQNALPSQNLIGSARRAQKERMVYYAHVTLTTKLLQPNDFVAALCYLNNCVTAPTQ